MTDLSQINVTVNQSVSVTVVAEDPNNDTLSFSIIGVLPSDAVLLNNSNSITITWNGTTEQARLTKTAFVSPSVNIFILYFMFIVIMCHIKRIGFIRTLPKINIVFTDSHGIRGKRQPGGISIFEANHQSMCLP